MRVGRTVMLGVAVAMTLHPAAVSAQRVVIVPVAQQQQPFGLLHHAAEGMQTELEGRRVPLVSMAQAAARIQERVSTTPSSAATAAIDQVTQCVDRTRREYAMGRRQRALRIWQSCIEQSQRVIEVLNREQVTAERLYQTCLFAVQAHLDSRRRQQALDQALQCRRMAPDLQINREHHAPEVAALIAQAEQSLGQSGGRLSVRSSPRGCAVYVNGRRMGRTPLTLSRLVPGRYRVQLECDHRPTRVHQVEVGRDPTELNIDARFDRVLVTEERFGLLYSAAAADPIQLTHLQRVLRGVGITSVWALHLEQADPSGGTIRIDRISANGVVASARLRVGRDGSGPPGVVWAAYEALQEGRSVDLSSSPPRPMQPWRPGGVTPSSGPSDSENNADPSSGDNLWNWALGGGLIAAGAGALIIPIVALAQLGQCAEPVAPLGGERGCAQVHTFGAGNGTWLGVGLISIITGLVVGITQPIAVNVQATQQSLLVRWSGVF